MSELKSALIIASFRYDHPDLRQLVAPAQDAESLARVLADPALGGFQVRTLINEPSHKVNLEIEDFCDNRKRDDVLLLYFSGHGIKDADGRLYFATADTLLVQHNVKRATAVSADFVNQMMNRSRSRRQILLLDCCYSGAFKHGMLAKGDRRVGAGEQFEGRGRIVLTASDALQYSFEGKRVEGEGVRSIFTRTLVHGLETGEADLDRDGFFSLDEVYDYVYDRVLDEQPEQKPTKMGYVEGRIFIGSNPRPLATTLPPELQETLEDSRHWVRAGAVTELERLLACNRKGLVLAARQALASLASEDDSQQVRMAAARCLASWVAARELSNESASEHAADPELLLQKTVLPLKERGMEARHLERVKNNAAKQERLVREAEKKKSAPAKPKSAREETGARAKVRPAEKPSIQAPDRKRAKLSQEGPPAAEAAAKGRAIGNNNAKLNSDPAGRRRGRKTNAFVAPDAADRVTKEIRLAKPRGARVATPGRQRGTSKAGEKGLPAAREPIKGRGISRDTRKPNSEPAERRGAAKASPRAKPNAAADRVAKEIRLARRRRAQAADRVIKEIRLARRQRVEEAAQQPSWWRSILK